MAPKKDIKDWLKKAENLNDQTNGDPTPIISSFQYPDGRYVAKEYQEAFGGNIIGNLEFPKDIEHGNIYPSSSSDFANLTLKIDNDQWIQITDSMGTGLGAYNKCIRLEVGDVKGAYAVFERVARRKGQRAPAIEYREVEGGTKIAARFVDGCGLTWILVGPAGNASTSNN